MTASADRERRVQRRQSDTARKQAQRAAREQQAKERKSG